MLSPQAAGLACPNYAAGGSPRQQQAGLATTSPWFQTGCSLPRRNLLPLSIQTICLTVRLDMDHGPMLYRTTSVVAGENAAPDLFANLDQCCGRNRGTSAMDASSTRAETAISVCGGVSRLA